MDNNVARNMSCSHCSKKYIFKDIGIQKPYGQWPHPMLLECGHSICKICTTTTLEKSIRFKCDLCKQMTPSIQHTPEWKDFPLNFYLIGANKASRVNIPFKDANIDFSPAGFNMKKQKSKEPNQPMVKLEICVECSSKTSKFSCQECKAFFCCPCFKKVHNAAKYLKKHVKVPLQELEDAGDKWVPPQVALCVQHPEQKLEFYCSICEEVVCSYCVITQHQGHSIVTLLSKNKDSLSRLGKVQRTALEVMKRLANTQKEIQNKLRKPQHTKEMADMEQKMVDHFVYLHGVLQRLEKDMLGQLHDMKVQRIKSLEEKSVELTSAANQLRMLMQEAELASNLSAMSGINIADITGRLQFATQNLPCILLPPDEEDDDNLLSFVADESLVDHMKTHFDLELPPEEVFNIVPLRDVPEDMVLEPVDIQNMC